MEFIKKIPIHRQLVLFPLSIMGAGWIVLALIIVFTYARFDKLSENLTNNDFLTLQKTTVITVEIGDIYKQASEIFKKSGEKLDEEAVYTEGQKVMDRIRALIKDVDSFKFNFLTEGGTEVRENVKLKQVLLNSLNEFLSKLTSALTMVTVDLDLSEQKLKSAADTHRKIIYEINLFSEELTKNITAEYNSANDNVRDKNLILLAVIGLLALIIMKYLQKYVSKLSVQIGKVNTALEDLANDKDADIPDGLDNDEMDRIIQSLLKYQATQNNLHRAMDELTDIKENLEILVDERTEQLRVFEEIFQNTDEGIYVADIETRIIKVNSAFCKIMGYDESEILGQKTGTFKSGNHDRMFYSKLWEDLLENGSWSGEIWDKRKNGEVFPQILTINTVDNTDGKAAYYVGIFHDITEIKEVEKKLETMAYSDNLTQIPNRAMFSAAVQNEIRFSDRYKEPFAILYLDLDGFKGVNDNLGHKAGDKVLQTIAERLKGSLRESDLCARMGGDEFTAIIKKSGSEEDLLHIAQKIIDKVSLPVETESGEAQVGVSIGVAIYPAHGGNYDEILHAADSAMYDAKLAGKGCVRFYTADEK